LLKGRVVSNTELSGFLGYWLPRLESEMREQLSNVEPAVMPFYQMMQYHMGWLDEDFRPYPALTGKRLRPMLCLLACAEVGGDPVQALPAAAAIEILHNFSLVHDDIEDGDELRRHRPTVWKLWGQPQAINVGDGMFTLAYASIQRLPRRGISAELTIQAMDLFTQTCLALTEGQYLDMSFEQRNDVTVSEYLRMIEGKTAALVGASVAIGALLGGAAPAQVDSLRTFGQSIGLAFQIQDDILGIWGDPEETGKAVGNDILRRKKSLPILHTLRHDRAGEQFETLLAAEPSTGHIERAHALLAQADARAFAERQMLAQHAQGMAALQAALGERATTSTLAHLADGLLHRRT
jgi:geranylgeranyl diphosphate synthase type I